EYPAHEDMAELMDQNGHEHAGDPDQQELEARLQRRPAEQQGHQPEPRADTDAGAEHAPAQVVGRFLSLEKHSSPLPQLEDESLRILATPLRGANLFRIF